MLGGEFLGGDLIQRLVCFGCPTHRGRHFGGNIGGAPSQTSSVTDLEEFHVSFRASRFSVWTRMPPRVAG